MRDDNIIEIHKLKECNGRIEAKIHYAELCLPIVIYGHVTEVTWDNDRKGSFIIKGFTRELA